MSGQSYGEAYRQPTTQGLDQSNMMFLNADLGVDW